MFVSFYRQENQEGEQQFMEDKKKKKEEKKKREASQKVNYVLSLCVFHFCENHLGSLYAVWNKWLCY